MTNTIRGLSGRLDLNFGTYDLVIETGFPPNRVYTCVDTEGQQVCQGDISYVWYENSEIGFTLHCIIRSNVASVFWLAERP